MTYFSSKKNKTSTVQSGGKKKSRRPGCLLILAVLYLIILAEGMRAKHDWNAYTDHWESKGEIFDIQALIPAKLPPSEDFVQHPIISELFNSDDTPRLKKLSLAEIPHLQQAVRFAQLPTTTRDRRRALGTTHYSLTDYLAAPHSISDEHPAAEFILERFKPLHLLFDELEQASKTPLAKFPLNYDDSLTMEYPHLDVLQEAVKTLALKSRAQLTIGNSHAATLDLLKLLRLAELTGSEPTIMSHLLQNSFCKSALALIHFGLTEKRFNPDHLIPIQAALESQKLEKRLLLSIRTERAMALSFIDDWAQGRLPALDNAESSAEPNLMFRLCGFLQIPKPFIYRNKLNYAKFIQEHGLNTKEEINLNRINFETLCNIKTDLQAKKNNSYIPFNPYFFFVQISIHPFQDIAETSLETAGRIDLARIAIALELHRIEHGTYPQTLAPLAPHYLKSLPLDLISGEPLHYRLKADGTPIIYSVGLNQIDEGGLLKKDRKLGDWVWQYTLPDGFNSTEWRE